MLQRGRRGVGMLAVRSGCPVLPVHLSGSFHLFRNLFRRRVTIRFGKPFRVADSPSPGVSVKEWYRRIGEETMARIKELQDGHHD